jgi:uncharacterized protein
MNGNRVIILCKAPVAGRVKTRLMPDYPAEEAADLHAAMARTVIARARSLFSDVRVAADDPGHPFFAALGLHVVAQGEGDLGQRLMHLSNRAFAEHGAPVIFLGTDSPHMQEQRLLRAAELVRSHDIVLGPVEDGGYDLIACRSCHPGVFDHVRWGSPHVLDDTLARIGMLGLSSALLEISFDVDRAEDVARARACGWKPSPA